LASAEHEAFCVLLTITEPQSWPLRYHSAFLLGWVNTVKHVFLEREECISYKGEDPAESYLPASARSVSVFAFPPSEKFFDFESDGVKCGESC